MTFKELVSSLEPPKDAMQRALWLVKKGDWDGAHAIVSDVDSTIASRIHAHLHRGEGDLSNARYWYAQAGVPPVTESLDVEWETLARDLTR